MIFEVGVSSAYFLFLSSAALRIVAYVKVLILTLSEEVTNQLILLVQRRQHVRRKIIAL
jgi:hypothetical protein